MIDRSELDQVFKEMGKTLSPTDIQRMIEVCDVDGDGQISYEEFVKQVFKK